MEVAILDYGVGNLFSIRAALEKLGVETKTVKSIVTTFGSAAVVLPGVGNFTPVAKMLSNEVGVFKDLVNSGSPILGICLGLQVLLESSQEGSGSGLGLFSGHVLRLPNTVKVPHMGWNKLTVKGRHEFMDNITDGSWVYFVHSYYPSPNDSTILLAETEYGVRFPSIIGDRNIVGTQFHPEKSGDIGSKLLQNFIQMAKR